MYNYQFTNNKLLVCWFRIIYFSILSGILLCKSNYYCNILTSSSSYLQLSLIFKSLYNEPVAPHFWHETNVEICLGWIFNTLQEIEKQWQVFWREDRWSKWKLGVKRGMGGKVDEYVWKSCRDLGLRERLMIKSWGI